MTPRSNSNHCESHRYYQVESNPTRLQNHQTSSHELQHLAAIAPRAPHSPRHPARSRATATNHSRPPETATEPRTQPAAMHSTASLHCTEAVTTARHGPEPKHRQKKNTQKSDELKPVPLEREGERVANLSWNCRAGEGDFANNLTGVAPCYLAAADAAGREAPVHRRPTPRLLLSFSRAI